MREVCKARDILKAGTTSTPNNVAPFGAFLPVRNSFDPPLRTKFPFFSTFQKPRGKARKQFCRRINEEAGILFACRCLHRYNATMADGPRISHTSAMILQAIGIGHIYGYTVMEVTGLASGTVYPALRRLERDQLIRSQWERPSIAEAALRPARRYYKLTRSGEAAVEASRKRYPLLAKLASKEEEVKDV